MLPIAAQDISESAVITRMTFRQLFEPRYLSSHPCEQTQLNINAITPSLPELQEGSPLVLQFGLSEHSEAQSGRKPHLDLLSSLMAGDWDCALYCSFERLSQKRMLPWGRYGKGLLMVWTSIQSRNIRFAFRFEEIYKFHHRWLVVLGMACRTTYPGDIY